MGNPNIVEDTKGKKTGPKTEIGIVRRQACQAKYSGDVSVKIRNSMDSAITRMMKEAGVDFKIPEKAIKQRSLFEIWLKEHSVKELTEISQMDKMIQLLNMDMTQRVMEKITMGIALDSDDVKLIRLLKDSLVDLHKMKYGEKKVNLNIYQDIREIMMTDEDTRSK